MRCHSPSPSPPVVKAWRCLTDGLSFSQGNQRFDYRVEVAGAEAESVESKPDAGDFSIEYNIETTADGESVWMTLLIALLAILVVYGGVRTARSRGGAKF